MAITPLSKRIFRNRIVIPFDQNEKITNLTIPGTDQALDTSDRSTTATNATVQSNHSSNAPRKSILSSSVSQSQRRAQSMRVSFAATIETIHVVENLKKSLSREERSQLWDLPPPRDEEEDSLESRLNEVLLGVSVFDDFHRKKPKSRKEKKPKKSHENGNNTLSPISFKTLFRKSKGMRKCVIAPIRL